MVIAITPGEIWEWIYDEDLETEPEKQTVFFLRVLTKAESTWVNNQFVKSTPTKKGWRARKGDDEAAIQYRVADLQNAAIMLGLADVKGLKDKKGNLVDYETTRKRIDGQIYDVPAEAFLDRIHSEILVALGNAILAGEPLEEADQKNSP